MKALIVGAGIGGLTTALALHRAGIEAHVFERATALAEVGAGISLWANAIACLQSLGVGQEIVRAGVAYDGAGLRIPDGRRLGSISVEALQRRFAVPIVVLHRAELMNVLRQAAGDASIHLGKTVTRLEDGAERVRIELADGTHEEADIVIGADGLHSVVRASLHGLQPPRYAGCTAWRGVVTFANATTATETWGRGNVFGQVPMRGGRVYWYATQNAPPGGANPDEKTALLGIFGGWHAPIPDLIQATAAEAILRNDIYDRAPLRTWGRGRVTLVGDAAHPMTPYLGQGGCQAIEDAVALTGALAGRTSHVSIDAALRAYEAKRIRRTTMFVNRSRAVGRMAQMENRLGIAVRNAMLKRIPARLQTQGVIAMLDPDGTLR